MSHGLSLRPVDTLLIERALDFLAGGAADARTLVSHVCQLPAVTAMIAERTADALLVGHPGFARCADGRWRLSAHPEPAAPVATAGGNSDSTTVAESAAGPRESDAPRVQAVALEPAPAPKVERVIPSFDEWLAARSAEERNRPAIREPEPAPAPSGFDPIVRRASPAIVPESERSVSRRARSGRAAETPVAPRPGDDDLLSSLSYVVVDVETTGGNPHTGHRITEIAAVTVRNGQVQEEIFETLVNPERSIPPMIVALTNISWEMVRDKPRFREVCPDLVRALEGHVFVAHNASFDWKFVSHEIERASGQTIAGRKLCTVRLARRILPQLPRRSLDWVSRHYGVEIAARHRAAGDAVATAHCLVRLLRDAESRGIRTWGELEMLLNARTGAARRRRKTELSVPRSARGDESA